MYQTLNILETYPVTTLYYCVQFDDNTQYEKNTITKPAVRKRKSGGNKTVFPQRKRPQNNANVQMGSLGTARRPETGRRRTLGKFCVGNCPVDITISIGRLGRSGNGCWEGGRKGGREGRKEGGREGVREGGKEGGRERGRLFSSPTKHNQLCSFRT